MALQYIRIEFYKRRVKALKNRDSDPGYDWKNKLAQWKADGIKPETATSRRTGLLAVKLGMTQTWTEFGGLVPLTALQVCDYWPVP